MLLFQNSERMESAYGLAITVTMLMTTTLLTSYIAGILKHKLGACVFALLFGAIELCFFASCLTMFFDGGYVMIFLAALLFGLMYVWRRGTAIERTQTILLPVSKYIDQLGRLRNDETYPVLADNLVFLTNSPDPLTLDRDVLYSILDKHPKRAKHIGSSTYTLPTSPIRTSIPLRPLARTFCSACAWTWVLRSTSASTLTCARSLAT